MRLLFLNHNVAFRSGTFNRAIQIGEALADRGHRVTLLAISPSNRWKMQHTHARGVDVIETPDLLVGAARSGWDPYNTLRRIGLVRDSDWDLVHAFDCRPAVILPALVARNASNAPLVIDWCDWWGRGGTIEERSGWAVRTLFGPVETYFEEAFRTRATATTVISTPLKQRAIGLGVPASTIHIVPQGCDTVRIYPGNRAMTRDRLGFARNAPLVATVGALLRHDSSLLWDAFRAVLSQRPDATLLVVGNHRTHLPVDLVAAGKVHEVGLVSDTDLVTYVAAADVMLTPLADTIASRARWPSRINYFLASGKAIVTTAVGDLPVLLAGHGAAAVCEPSGQALAERVVAVLESPSYRLELEQKARWFAETVLPWPSVIDRLEAAYSTVMASRDGRAALSPVSRA